MTTNEFSSRTKFASTMIEFVNTMKKLVNTTIEVVNDLKTSGIAGTGLLDFFRVFNASFRVSRIYTKEDLRIRMSTAGISEWAGGSGSISCVVIGVKSACYQKFHLNYGCLD